MITRTFEFEDINGNQRKETHYFHMRKADLTKMEYGRSGGMEVLMTEIMEKLDAGKLMALIDEVIKKSYGKKMPDGKFVKDPAAAEDFMNGECYDQLFMELINPEKFTAFLMGVIPQDIAAATQDQLKANHPELFTDVTIAPVE